MVFPPGAWYALFRIAVDIFSPALHHFRIAGKLPIADACIVPQGQHEHSQLENRCSDFGRQIKAILEFHHAELLSTSAAKRSHAVCIFNDSQAAVDVHISRRPRAPCKSVVVLGFHLVAHPREPFDACNGNLRHACKTLRDFLAKSVVDGHGYEPSYVDPNLLPHSRVVLPVPGRQHKEALAVKACLARKFLLHATRIPCSHFRQLEL
mmetsp:Transcript_10620/g.19482  ORF Transcript_10620/g.19482 Transcript_10620/m.19482 type:complete len:208 (-) Transcript_10620:124-747(-)